MPDYYVAFWNLENLFDINNSPRRSEKLQRTLKSELSKWTTPVLNRKIQQLASIIRQMNQGRGKSSNKDGYSDHFPIAVQIKEA